MRLVKAFLLCLSMQALTLSAQMFIFPTTYGPSDKYQVVDTAKYEITYQIAAKLNPNPKYSHVAYKDTQTLLIGKRISATYSRELLKAREKADGEIKQGAETVDSFSDITFPEDVFKGYPKPGALTTSYRLFLSAGYGQYTEHCPTSSGRSSRRPRRSSATRVRKPSGNSVGGNTSLGSPQIFPSLTARGSSADCQGSSWRYKIRRHTLSSPA